MLSLASFSATESNCALGGTLSSDMTKKHQTDTKEKIKKNIRVEDRLRDDRKMDKKDSSVHGDS